MRCGTAFVALLMLAALAPRTAVAGPALVIEVSNSKVLYAEDADGHTCRETPPRCVAAAPTNVLSGEVGD